MARHELTPPHVRILMCTFNGADHLRAQLQSFVDQTHADWSLWVADDGSDDATLAILTAFRIAHPWRHVRVMAGPGRGAAVNFLSLLAYPDIGASHVAFADQDDVWMPQKLCRGLQHLAAAQGPAVYASRTVLADAALRVHGVSSLHRRGPDFGNALVQNILAGNTIMLNPAATSLVRQSGPAATATGGVPFHDWWVYLVLSGAGAQIMTDDAPTVIYRQHGRNQLGSRRGAGAWLRRVAIVRAGGYGAWIDANLAALTGIAQHLTPENRTRLECFVALRAQAAAGPVGAFRRLFTLRRIGLHRQTPMADLLLCAMVLRGQV